MRAGLWVAAVLGGLVHASNAAQRTVAPRGIENTGNFCYMASMLQALFWVPEVRQHVLAPPAHVQPGAVHLALAQFFSEMQSSSRRYVSPRHSLLPVIIQAMATDGEMVEVGDADDPDAFLRFLEKHVLGSMPRDVMGVRVQQRRVLGVSGRSDVALAMGPAMLPASFGMQVNVNDDRDAPIHDLLVSDAANTLRFTHEDFYGDGAFTLLDAAGNRSTVDKVGPFSTVDMALIRMGAAYGDDLTAYYQRRLAGPLPRALVISASKFGYDLRRDRATWNRKAATRFEQSFTLPEFSADSDFPVLPQALVGAGVISALEYPRSAPVPDQMVQYDLHAIVFHVPDVPHYVVAVRTNPGAMEWTLFDDTTVTRLNGPPLQDRKTGRVEMHDLRGHRISGASKRQPYMFVYAQTAVSQEWIATGASAHAQDLGPHSKALQAVLSESRGIIGAIQRITGATEEEVLALAAIPAEDSDSAHSQPRSPPRSAMKSTTAPRMMTEIYGKTEGDSEHATKQRRVDREDLHRPAGRLFGSITENTSQLFRQNPRPTLQSGGFEALFSEGPIPSKYSVNIFDDVSDETETHIKSKKSHKKHRKHKKSHKKRCHDSSSSSSSSD